MNKQIILLECCYSLYVIVTIIAYPFLIAFSVIRGLYRCLKAKVDSQKSIAGEVALITGSGRGLGRATAIELAKLGCHIAIVDIQGKLAQETADYIAETYGVKAKAYKIDVTNFEQLLDLKTRVTTDLGDVTILINNAAILTLSSIGNPPAQEVQRMVNVNFIATVYTIQIFLPKMKQLNRGHIVNISSISALMPSPIYSVYSATKSALRHFTSSLRIELMQSHSNITATTVMPTALTTNKRAEKLVRAIGATKVGTIADGDIAAQYVVSAMLRGVDELTVPRVFIYYHRLMSLFGAGISEKLIALGTMDLWENRNCDEVINILNLNDIQTDI